MCVVITKNGRSSRSDLAHREIFAGAKKVAIHRWNKAVRRDASRIIQEQLEEVTISAQEQRSITIQEEALCMERLFYGGLDYLDEHIRQQEEGFWGWDTTEEHEREMDYFRERQWEQERQEQLAYFLDCDERYLYGLA